MFNGLIVVAFALEPVRPGDGGFICVPGCAPPPEPPGRRSALTLVPPCAAAHKANVPFRPPADSPMVVNPTMEP